MALRDYQLVDADVAYADESADIVWEVAGLDHAGDGDVSPGAVLFDTTTRADRARLSAKGVPYLRDAGVEATGLVRLDRVPDFAAVNSAVELSKEIKHGAASGLVNALLRRFLREGKRIALPSRAQDPAGHLAVAYSHPRWLVERWLEELRPADTEALLAANNTAAPTVVRINRRRCDVTQLVAALAEAGIVASPGAYAADALGPHVEHAHFLRTDKPFVRAGRVRITVQLAEIDVQRAPALRPIDMHPNAAAAGRLA